MSTDDVVEVENENTLGNAITSTVDEMLDAIYQNSDYNKDFKEWIGEGVPCRVLRETGGGWQKGKVRVRIEFVPDVPDTPKSDLDELRERINQEVGKLDSSTSK